MKALSLVLFLAIFQPLIGHEGHDQSQDASIIHWLGNFHPILNDFVIAFITGTLIAELLFKKYKDPLFDHAATFMLFGASIAVIPSGLFGIAFGYQAGYEGIFETYYHWHIYGGIATILLTPTALHFKLYDHQKAYLITLTLLFIILFCTAYLGGELTYGINHLFW